MHVDAATLDVIQQTLGCMVEGFPQTYLGLPLSAEKLRLSAFSPLIAKVDRYLSGWRAAVAVSGRAAHPHQCRPRRSPRFRHGRAGPPAWGSNGSR
jgi:hypothetical protein